MRYTLITLAALAASVTAQTTGTIGLGADCTTDSDCALGAQCFGTTSDTRKTCGSFNAACTSDSQCATNTCQSGLCKGPLASESFRITSTSTPTSTDTGSSSQTETLPTAITPTVTAAPGSLELGALCSTDEQCPAGVQCYGTTAFTDRRCGGFNAACASDADCSTNTCVSGICKGPLASESWKVPSSTTAATESVTGMVTTQGEGVPASTETQTATSTGSMVTVVASGTGSSGTMPAMTTSAAPTGFTGAAVKANIGSGVVAAAALFAFAL